MAQTSKAVEFDPNECTRNRNKWTLEQLAPYRDQWVAWSLDGKSIIAHDDNLLKVVRVCKELGLSGEDYLLAGIPLEDELWV